MKKAINMYAVPDGMSFETSFKIIKDSGFDGVELNYELAPRDTLNLWEGSTQEEKEQIKDLLKKYDLEMPSIVCPNLWQYCLTSNDEKTREKGIEIIKQLIQNVKFFGGNTVLVVPGKVDEETSYLDAYNNTLNCMLLLKDFATQEQIHIGIENVWNKFLLSPIEMRDLIDKIDCPYIGSYFDVGNVVINSYPEYWIETLGSRIKKVHFKDFKRSIGNIEGFVDLLAGDVDFIKVINALKSVGYDDYVTAELPPYRQFPKNLFENTAVAMDSIVNKLENKPINKPQNA